tara:strand:+ start:636 stop:770 length:135 start_codon:yes stop_codon:yes gene_type:complete
MKPMVNLTIRNQMQYLFAMRFPATIMLLATIHPKIKSQDGGIHV